MGEENGDLRQEVDRLTSEAEEAATRADERDGQLTEVRPPRRHRRFVTSHHVCVCVLSGQANEDRERLSGQLEECLALAEAAASLRDQVFVCRPSTPRSGPSTRHAPADVVPC